MSRLQLMQGLDTNIHCLAVELSGWVLFVKPLKVILSKCFVVIKQSQLLNVNMMLNRLNKKQFPVWFVNICVCKCCVFLILHVLPAIVRGICLFDNFEKLSMLLGVLRDILEGWARGSCVHVFLVWYSIPQKLSS